VPLECVTRHVREGPIGQYMLDQSLSRRLREIQDARTVDEQCAEAPSPEPVAPAPELQPPARTPLGRLLIEKGEISEDDLETALLRQESDGRPLGQILLEMGVVSEQSIARSVTEQHGLDSSASLRRRIAEGEAEIEDDPEGHAGERYLVRENRTGEPLESADSFLDATDAAFELIEERDPAELEIVRLQDGECERLWSYRRDDAEGDRSAPHAA
jgi:hypothetical protein